MAVTCLAVLALWSIRLIHTALKASEDEGEAIALVDDVWTDTDAIAQNFANMMIFRALDEERAEKIKSLRTERLAIFDRLKAKDTSQEGQSLLTQTEKAATQWGGVNNQLVLLMKAHKGDDAVKLYREQAIPRYSEVASLISAYKTLARQKLAEVNRQTASLTERISTGLISFSLLVALVAVLLGGVLARSITAPLTVVVTQLSRIADGDISGNVAGEYLDRTDEIGAIGRGLQLMTVALRRMIQEVSSEIKALSSSSTALMTSSAEMTSGSRNASDKAHSFSAAADEMSSNITSVAAAMEQTTTNLAHVSSATEQMTATIAEIAQNSENARRITNEATRQAVRITEQMSELGVAAREIGKVTETITEISSQTNLLALNATIEAARAGSAGKGFAVVATEIKALAQQTSAATEDIKCRIEGVQSATAGGIQGIGEVSQVIAEVSAIVASIAAAIEEQSTATRDIASNIAEACTGVTDANARVSQTSHVSCEIAKDIVSVDQSAREMANGSNQVRASAGELSVIAETLRVTVGGFQA